METISQYPELMSAMKHYNDNNSFEKVIWLILSKKVWG